MVRVIRLKEGSTEQSGVIYLNPRHVLWVAEGGPGYCFVQLAMQMDEQSQVVTRFKVLGPAQELAKQLAVSEPSESQEVA